MNLQDVYYLKRFSPIDKSVPSRGLLEEVTDAINEFVGRGYKFELDATSKADRVYIFCTFPRSAVGSLSQQQIDEKEDFRQYLYEILKIICFFSDKCELMKKHHDL